MKEKPWEEMVIYRPGRAASWVASWGRRKARSGEGEMAFTDHFSKAVPALHFSSIKNNIDQKPYGTISDRHYFK